MVKSRALKIRLIILAVIILSLTGFLLMIVMYESDIRSFLEKSSRVNANLLIIESWLPDKAIELSKTEIQNGNYNYIVTTGIRSSELDFCMVAENGYLIFFPKFLPDSESFSNKHKIEVVARSKMGGKYCCHFNFFINDTLIADFNADEKVTKYSITWNRPLSEIDSVMIQFTNDYLDEYGDRNLYVKELIIDNEKVIPYQFNSIFDIGMIGGSNRIVNNHRSQPEVIRNRLISEGIDSAKIIAVSGGKTMINRTLTGALAFRKWLNRSGYKVTGVNIVSMSIHARRTWITYKHILDKSCDIGIISLPYFKSPDSNRSELTLTAIELLDLIYYRIILTFY